MGDLLLRVMRAEVGFGLHISYPIREPVCHPDPHPSPERTPFLPDVFRQIERRLSEKTRPLRVPDAQRPGDVTARSASVAGAESVISQPFAGGVHHCAVGEELVMYSQLVLLII